jgi:hypothetical protein
LVAASGMMPQELFSRIPYHALVAQGEGCPFVLVLVASNFTAAV